MTEFNHAHEIGQTFKGDTQLRWLQSWGPAWNMVPSKDAFVFVDNHDIQRDGSSDILTHKTRDRYTMAVAFMLSHTYGTPRVMSSYAFTDFNQGTHAPKLHPSLAYQIQPNSTSLFTIQLPFSPHHVWLYTRSTRSNRIFAIHPIYAGIAK